MKVYISLFLLIWLSDSLLFLLLKKKIFLEAWLTMLLHKMGAATMSNLMKEYIICLIFNEKSFIHHMLSLRW